MRGPQTTALIAFVLVTAGCVGAGGQAQPTATPLPPGTVDMPDGPKERPERPATLDTTSVSDYLATLEYRIASNSLWVSEYTEVTLDCRVDDVTERPWGYRADVTCTGYSDTTVPADATATAGPHADWFTQSYRYRVSQNATHRERVDSRDPVG